MANEKIYVVTKGDYSDYHIVAATLDKELAEKIAAKFTDDWDTCDVEEYDDAEVMMRPAWFIYFDKTGNVIGTRACDSSYDYFRIGRCWPYEYGQQGIGVAVTANDLESAIKIAAEKRAQYLAEKMDL